MRTSKIGRKKEEDKEKRKGKNNFKWT